MNPPDLRPWFQTLEDIPESLVWSEFFGNTHPVEVEVGTGRGLFLVNAGTGRPDTNFLGLELDYKEARYAARRMKKRELPNVRIVGGDARIALARMADRSVEAVHVYFPDPWWKRRHRRRRIFDAPFVTEAARILDTGGQLHAWTDVQEYFGVMLETVGENPSFSPQPTAPERAAAHDLDYQTNFERKKRQLGLPIYRALWTRSEWQATAPHGIIESAERKMPSDEMPVAGS